MLIAYLVNCWKYERAATFEYKFSAIITVGLVLQTEVIHFTPKISNGFLRLFLQIIPPTVNTLLLIFVLHQGLYILNSLEKQFFDGTILLLDVIFSLFSGFVTVITYHGLFSFTLRKMPKSFTYGEASIVIQASVIFLTNLYFKLIHIAKKTSECVNESSNSVSCVADSHWTKNPSEMEQLSTILQVIMQIKQIKMPFLILFPFSRN